MAEGAHGDLTMVCKKCRKEIPDISIYCMFCGRKQVNADRIKRRPNGAGSVYRMSGSRSKPWRAVIREGTRRIQVGTYATQTEALKALAAYEPQGSVVRNDMTLEDIYEAWIETKRESLSESSLVMYDAAWKQLTSIRTLPIAELRTQDYQKIIDSLRGSKSRSSLSKIKILASQLCKWACQNDIIDKNYAEFIELPGEKKEEGRMYFTDDEIGILWKNAAEPAVQIVLAMIYTGMRINELFSLKVSDVHMDEPIQDGRKVSYVIGGEKTEAGKNRVIVLHSKIVPYFAEWVAQGNGYLLVNANGDMINDRTWRRKHYYPTLERLGIEQISPHKARHTFATKGAKAGISQVVLQHLLGHASYETTADYYTHIDLAQLADGIELID